MGFTGGSNKAVYQCTALVGSNKKGVLKPDADGYYTLVVGGLNAFNSSGAYYPLGPAKALFEESSSFMRRIATGNCKGETGHPKPLPGQSMRDYIGRILQIEETRVCCHFRKIWLENEGIKDAAGRPIIGILAEVKPSGPMGPALKEALENPDENVNFSIRSLTNDVMSPAGYVQKNLKTIVTFDWVTEPGLSGSTKYNSPSLEGLEEQSFSVRHLDDLEQFSKAAGFAMENYAVDFKTLRKDFGWDNPAAGTEPASMRW